MLSYSSIQDSGDSDASATSGLSTALVQEQSHWHERGVCSPLARTKWTVLAIMLSVAAIIWAAVTLSREAPPPSPGGLVPPSQRPDLIPVFVMSDIHVDLFYRAAVGSRFCQSNLVQPNAPPSYYTPLGAYGCDAPLALLESALGVMRSLLPCGVDQPPSACTRAAAIIIVGDLVGHQVCCFCRCMRSIRAL